MNQPRASRRTLPSSLFALLALPLGLVLATAGCGPKDEAATTDSLSVATETPAPNPRYDVAMNDQQVTVAAGAEFEIALANDPAHAQVWTWVDSAGSSIVLVDRMEMAGEDHLGNQAGNDSASTAGGTGDHAAPQDRGSVTVWRFRAPATGSAPIRLELRRPGETTAAQVYNLTVNAG